MVGLSGGREVLRKTRKARISRAKGIRAGRERVADAFDLRTTADILQ